MMTTIAALLTLVVALSLILVLLQAMYFGKITGPDLRLDGHSQLVVIPAVAIGCRVIERIEAGTDAVKFIGNRRHGMGRHGIGRRMSRACKT